MAQNTLPPGIHDLMKRAAAMLPGLETHGPWLNFGAATAARFRPAMESLCAAESDFSVARSAKAAAGARAAASDAGLTEWLGKARLVVMLALGSQWSPAWIEAGFAGSGTNVPKRVAARLWLAGALVAFFRRRPELEVAFAGVTAAQGAALLAEADSARRALQEAASDAGEKKVRRDAAEAKLRREMRLVRACVALPLGESDPRWEAFGMKPPKPAAPRRIRQGKGPRAEVIELPVVVKVAREAAAA